MVKNEVENDVVDTWKVICVLFRSWDFEKWGLIEDFFV